MLDVICKYLSVVSLLILPNKVKLYCIGNSIKGKSVLPVDLKIYCVCVCLCTRVCVCAHTCVCTYTYRVCMHEGQERLSDSSQSEL